MQEYTIKEVSDMFQLPPSTLRYYEEIGLLTNIARTSSGKRIYTDMHINRLKTICCFKDTGMSISQLQAFFSYESTEAENIDAILTLLEEHKVTLTDKIIELQHSYEHLLRKLCYYNDIKTSIETDRPLPSWQDYKFKSFSSEK